MLATLLMKLYFTLIGGSILSAGLFTYFGVTAKTYQETKKWHRYMNISVAICTITIGAGIITLLWY